MAAGELRAARTRSGHDSRNQVQKLRGEDVEEATREGTATHRRSRGREDAALGSGAEGKSKVPRAETLVYLRYMILMLN